MSGHRSNKEGLIEENGYTYQLIDERDVFYLKILKGNKLLKYYRFRSAVNRQKYVEEYMKAVQDRVDEINKRKEERKNLRSTIVMPVVGDIFYGSWGYDQTNASFYKVTAVKGQMVVVREMRNKIVKQTRYENFVVPDVADGAPLRKKVLAYNGKPYIKIASYLNIRPWDGSPKHETRPEFGH